GPRPPRPARAEAAGGRRGAPARGRLPGGGVAAPPVRRARNPLRRGLHRLAADEPRGGDGGRRPPAPAVRRARPVGRPARRRREPAAAGCRPPPRGIRGRDAGGHVAGLPGCDVHGAGGRRRVAGEPAIRVRPLRVAVGRSRARRAGAGGRGRAAPPAAGGGGGPAAAPRSRRRARASGGSTTDAPLRPRIRTSPDRGPPGTRGLTPAYGRMSVPVLVSI